MGEWKTANIFQADFADFLISQQCRQIVFFKQSPSPSSVFSWQHTFHYVLAVVGVRANKTCPRESTADPACSTQLDSLKARKICDREV